ncbi:MAG: Gfo/Idh/MocA family oxidoreductase [Bryobacteraceae bacterium]
MVHNMIHSKIVTALVLASAFGPVLCSAQPANDTKPLRLAIAGLVHGHVDGFFHALEKRPDVQLVGIFDPDKALQQHYAQHYKLADSLFFTDLGVMLDQTKPEAVAAFSSTLDHAMIVQTAAKRHVDVMMEKPLAVGVAQAELIQSAARQSGIQVIVNYETTWYKSHGAIWQLVKQQHALGDLNRIVAMDGHEGPKEIHVGPEFLNWLTDPAKNGAGALYDFGCYGANLMTWLMDNQRPVAVTALLQTVKPQVYPRVDDQATVLVQYPNAQGVIQASWNWPFSRKDLEVYGKTGYAIATGGNTLHVRLPNQAQEQLQELAALPPDEADSISYLKAVVRGKLKPAGLSSLENNMIVTAILAAARESAKTGKTVQLH